MNSCKQCKWYDKIKVGIDRNYDTGNGNWEIEEVCANPKTSNCFIPNEKTCERWEEK